MKVLHALVLQGLMHVTLGHITNLYVASSDGKLTTLALRQSSGVYNLSVSSVTQDCANNPSWLTLDSDNGILYCLDRDQSTSVNGSLNSFSVGHNGSLKRIDRVNAPASGVYLEQFGSGQNRGIATVSYNRSAVAVFASTRDGQLEGPVQQFYPTIPKTGPIASRQDRSFMHQVLLDPSKKLLFANDLGGDIVRIFTWDSKAKLALSELEPLHTDAGAGPRHGVFWQSPSDKALYYIFVGELSQKVYSYRIKYTGAGVSWTKVYEAFAVGEQKLALLAPASEINLSPDNRFVVISNRETSFGRIPAPSDTLSTWSIAANGTLGFVQATPSGGWLPRHFSINRAGDLLAVGHQTNYTVAIWRRNVKTGLVIPETNGQPAALLQLSGPVVCTIWDE